MARVRNLLTVLGTLVLAALAGTAAHAQTQVPVGVTRTVTPDSPVCILSAGTCKGQFGTVDWTTGHFRLMGTSASILSADESITVTPYAGNVPRTTSFALLGVSKLSLLTNFLATFSIQCQTGAGQPVGVNEGCVAGYFDTNAVVGGSQAWGFNVNVAQQIGFYNGGLGKSVIGGEINMNNFDHDNGNFDGDIGGIYPSSVGLVMTAIGGHTISAVLSVSTDGLKEWNRGIAFSPGSITQCSVCDYGSGAATVIDIRGAHSAYGIDGRQYTGGPFIRIPSLSAIVARNFADSSDIQLLAPDASNNINVGVGGAVGKVVIYGGGTPGLTINSTSMQINSFSVAGLVFNSATGLLSSSTTLPTSFFPALTGDITTPGGSLVTTLASIITAGGPTGSATVAPIITYDAKGRLTAVSSATITPAIGSITGLGTGVATALGNSASGSGSLCLTTSCTMVTPTLGVASATSLIVGATQTSIGQIGEFTGAYAAGSLNTSRDLVRVQVGSITPSMEVGSGSNPSTASFSASIEIPPGAYTGAATWPDAAISAYAVNGNATKSGLAFYALGGLEGAGRQVGGTNQSVVNCKLFDPTCTGTTGQDFSVMYASESDVNVYSNSGVAPAGAAAGFASILNATIQPTGDLSAYTISAVGSVKWKTGFATNTGCCDVGMSLAPLAATGSVDSQHLNMTSLIAGVPALGVIFIDGAGVIQISSAVGVSIAKTGYLKGVGAAAITAATTIPLSDLATQATNTVVGNATSGSAAPTALAVGSCSTASSALIWTTNTGFGCNTSITANAVPAANLTGTTLASGVLASSLTSVGTLTGGATGAGFTLNFGTSTQSGNVLATHGGTGQSSYAVGDILYAPTTTTISGIADIAVNNVLLSGGVGTAPGWGKVANAALSNSSVTIAGTSVALGASAALASKFIVQGTADSGLSAAQFLGALGTCILKNTTTTGVLSCTTAGTDYLTSVGLTFTGGLISVGSSPLTANGTLALTVAGTSGGIPYFSSTSAWASSALLVSNAIMIGGGAGAAPATTATGTGVLTALGINVGSAGALVTFNGALGTPSSGTATNLTGLPISSGVSGLGTGAAAALAINVGSAGAFVTFNGALGTPSSGTATNLTGLPISSGVSGLGTGVANALGIAVGSAGAFTTNNAANTFSAANAFSGGLAVTSSPLSKTTLDASGQTAFTIANGANQALTTVSAALAVVEDISTGNTAVVLLAGNPGVLIAQDTGSQWQISTTPTSGHNGISWNGSANYTIYNNNGTGTHSYKVVLINPN